jgi:hypothetical protein
MRPDAMTLEVTLGCATYGSQPPITLEDGTEVPGEPNIVKISGVFGEVDPLSIEDAAVVLPKLAFIFEALVKEHNARKQAEAQRAAMVEQAMAQHAAQQQAEAAAAAPTDQEVTDDADGADVPAD